MDWDWQNRSVRLSVGELSRFSLLSPAEERAGRWRMELGTHWHQVLRERTEKEQAGWTFEEPVAGTLCQRGWNFTLQGRIDQLLPGPEPLLREIKTVSCDLPAGEALLRGNFPQYFHQAMLYAFLLGRKGAFPRVELVLLEIQSGLTQTVLLGEEDLEALHAHLEKVVGELEERRGHFAFLRNLVVPAPFEEWRPGQEETREALEAALESHRIVLFEAPTGFGKTGLAFEQALLRMAGGSVDRILVLTGKNTGHTPLLSQLEAFRKSAPGLGIHALRSRRDHSLNEEFEAVIGAREIMERWMESGLSAPALLRDGILELDRIRALGRKHGIPPWAISRMLLPYADVWIADFNYLFDPAVASLLDGTPTHAPGRTFLVVDEAHNLPGRAAASRSHRLEAETVGQILSEVQFARFPGRLARLLDHLLSLLKAQKPVDCLDPPDEADLIGLLREVRDAFRESSFGEDELDGESREWLWNLDFLLADWDAPGLPIHCSSPRNGIIELSCLDAARVVGPVLKQFRWTLLMSASLQPWEAFLRAAGLTGESVGQTVGDAPWLAGCFEVMVDARVDTRFRNRDRFLDMTAATIGLSALDTKGCTVAFFPSYAYAERVMERLAFHYPALRSALQPGNLPLEEQNAFLDEALHFNDVLFLVLGSRFSEGIDILGGRVHRAIVVSPALPEVNARQRARELLAGGSRAEAFRSVYQIPGMRKITQAIGRLVRNPDQRARVLLQGRRFMEPDFLDLLPSYLQPVDTIITDQDLQEKWLRSP
ncbi:MAG: ATP-dependent DNA helicase [Oceanipulchritudo sp.]